MDPESMMDEEDSDDGYEDGDDEDGDGEEDMDLENSNNPLHSAPVPTDASVREPLNAGPRSAPVPEGPLGSDTAGTLSGPGVDMLDGTREGVSGPYIQLFLLKYTCPQPSCLGTLAPRPGEARSECNMCGGMRGDDQFMAEVEALVAVGGAI